ncbi:MAG TPA: hypothetical protein VF533_06240 [Solirubrobacteraceae bacterium]|jgi:hypothetical protein
MAIGCRTRRFVALVAGVVALAAAPAQAGVHRPAFPDHAVAPGDHAAYWDGHAMVANPRARNTAADHPGNRRQPVPTRDQWLADAYAGRMLTRPDEALTAQPEQAGAVAAAPRAGAAPDGVSSPYYSTEVDGLSAVCAQPGVTNEQVAQSSRDPDVIVVAAQAYADDDGCGQPHPWVFTSHDGGGHWKHRVIPVSYRAGGKPTVAYDPVRDAFVYAWLAFDMDSGGYISNGQIRTARSTDNGENWYTTYILDEDGGGVTVDKPMSTTDMNPGSPHYGRTVVTWSHYDTGGLLVFGDYSDGGGAGWSSAGVSVNTTASRCGNGSSPAFDANGDLMVAWWSCTSGTQLREQLSPTGGQSWPNGDLTITGIDDIGTGGVCSLNTYATGSQFRCNSYPSLAGDPWPGDSGGGAFAIVWADNEPVGGVNVSQIKGLSTVDGGATWGGPFFASSNNPGDKFLPWASFASTGRFNVTFASREVSATTENPKGTSFNQHYTWASSLSRLRGAAGDFATDTLDFASSSPGSAPYIGEYSGQTSNDNGYDTAAVFTGISGGAQHARIANLCYQPCDTRLFPGGSLGYYHSDGTSFSDGFALNTDPAYGGSGAGVWNVLAIRNGADNGTVDNDVSLYRTRYGSDVLASSTFGRPSGDYLLINLRPGQAPVRQYHARVRSYGSYGGAYTMQWVQSKLLLVTSLTDSMAQADTAKLYGMLDGANRTVYAAVRPAADNTASYQLRLHSAATGPYQGAPNASGASAIGAPGEPVFAKFTNGDATSNNVAVVQNASGVAGSYKVWRDYAVPKGTISIDNGARTTRSTAATLKLSATNATAGDPVMEMRFSTDAGTTWTDWEAYKTGRSLTLPPGDGTKTVQVEYRNGAGGTGTAKDSIVYDVTPPRIAAPPTPALFTGGLLRSGRVPVAITWRGSDPASGICRYELSESVNGGAYAAVTLSSPTATQAKRNEVPETTSYRYRVRAIDCAGNASAYSIGRVFKANVLQEINTAIAYSGTWTRTTQTGASGGSVKVATAAGAYARLAVSGAFEVGWVSTRGSGSGGAHVLFDGAAAGVVDLNAPSTTTAVLVHRRTISTASHAYRVNVDGTAGHPKVAVDAFVVLR